MRNASIAPDAPSAAATFDIYATPGTLDVTVDSLQLGPLRPSASLTEAAQRLREGAEQRWPQQELLLVDAADHLPAPVLAGLVEAAVEGVRALRHGGDVVASPERLKADHAVVAAGPPRAGGWGPKGLSRWGCMGGPPGSRI